MKVVALEASNQSQLSLLIAECLILHRKIKLYDERYMKILNSLYSLEVTQLLQTK